MASAIIVCGGCAPLMFWLRFRGVGRIPKARVRGDVVPEKLWIAGFGDCKIAGIAVPALTTINPFPLDIGVCAAALILDVPNGRQESAARVFIFPELLIHHSGG